MGHGVMDEGFVDRREGRGITEHDVGSPLDLVRTPVMPRALDLDDRGECGVDLKREAIEDPGPVQLDLLAQQALGTRYVLDIGEAVVVLDEVDASFREIHGQPLAAVHADLHRKRKPRLQADVHDAEARVPKVVVQVLALAGPQLEDEALLFP